MRTSLKIVIVLAFVVLCGGSGAVYFWLDLVDFGDMPITVRKDVVVTIPTGTGPHAVSQKLAQAGLITHAETFYRWVRWVKHAAGELKSGEYQFTKDQATTPAQILERLEKGEVLSIRVTIPEGLRIDEQAP